MITKHPFISVVIPTYNSQKTLTRCLKSIREQSYPQNKVEIIIVDGGSRDETKNISLKYHVKWFEVNAKKQNVEYNKAVGITKAKGELLLFVDHDNILPHSHLLEGMIQPFLKHKDMVGVETLRYYYDKKSSKLDRYFALFGVNDPLAFYLRKADRLSYMYDEYKPFDGATDYGNYYTVNFSSEHMPTIGANGFLVRRKTLVDHANVTPGKYFHIDVNADLVANGFTKYAFIKDSILHLSGYGDIGYYLKRRMLFMRQYYLSGNTIHLNKMRRYSLYEKKDSFRLFLFILFGLTFIVPVYDSIRGYMRIRDLAWFLNPFLCFSLVVLYGFVIVEHQLLIYKKRFFTK